MSALPLKVDIERHDWHVRLRPALGKSCPARAPSNVKSVEREKEAPTIARGQGAGWSMNQPSYGEAVESSNDGRAS
jgi:hypothetical protein